MHTTSLYAHAHTHTLPLGVAHTFFVGATDKPRAGELINVLREAGQDVPAALLAFGTTVKKRATAVRHM